MLFRLACCQPANGFLNVGETRYVVAPVDGCVHEEVEIPRLRLARKHGSSFIVICQSTFLGSGSHLKDLDRFRTRLEFSDIEKKPYIAVLVCQTPGLHRELQSSIHCHSAAQGSADKFMFLINLTLERHFNFLPTHYD